MVTWQYLFTSEMTLIKDLDASTSLVAEDAQHATQLTPFFPYFCT